MLVDLYLVAAPGLEGPGLDRLLEACVEAGLDGTCLVGQGTCPPMEAARRSRFADRLFLAYGVEIPLSRGRLIWIPEDPEALHQPDWKETVSEGIDGARALRERLGGVLIASHPYDRNGGPPFVDSILTLRFLDGVMGGSGAADHGRNLMACTAAQRLGIPALGGTGPGVGPEGVGASATAFVEALTTQRAMVAAVRSRDAWAVELLSRPDQLRPDEETAVAYRPREPGRTRGNPRGGGGAPSRQGPPRRQDVGPHAHRPGSRPSHRPVGPRPERGAR